MKMTLAGKCLAILNLLLSLVFMGLAVAAHNVATDLREELKTKSDLALELTKKQDEMAKVVKGLETQLRGEKKRYEDTAKENGRAIEGLETEIQQMRRDHEKADAEWSTTDSKLRTAQEEQQKSREKVQALRQMLATLEDEVLKLAANKQDLSNQIVQTQVGLEEVVGRNEGLVERLGELERAASIAPSP